MAELAPAIEAIRSPGDIVVGMQRTSTSNRDSNEFNDPLAKALLRVGMLLTAMFCIAVLLNSLVGMQFVGLLKFVTWLLGAFAVFGAICGLVVSIRWRTGAAARRMSAGL